MKLYLMRHAIAEELSENLEDSLRPLSSKGCRKLKKIANNLTKLDVDIDLILTSPYLRARQTADIVADFMKLEPEQVMENENLIPPGFADRLIADINILGGIDNLLLVGHEPFLSQFIGMLISGDANANITMKKAGLCKLSVDELSYGKCASLEWLLTPAQLQRLSI